MGRATWCLVTPAPGVTKTPFKGPFASDTESLMQKAGFSHEPERLINSAAQDPGI